jgi:hypothetical protein
MDDEEFSADYYAKRQKEQKAMKEAREAASQDPELQTIIQRSKETQYQTVESSDSAVRTLRETVKTSETTKTELVRQGEELKDIKGSAERADTSVTEAYENTRKIDKYSHFFPFFKSSGKKKRKEDREFKEKQKEIEKAKEAAKKAQQHKGGSKDVTSPANESAPNRGVGLADENEQRIDENLDEMSMHLHTLREDATFMQQNIQEQDTDIKEVQARTTHTQNVMEISDKKLQRHL